MAAIILVVFMSQHIYIHERRICEQPLLAGIHVNVISVKVSWNIFTNERDGRFGRSGYKCCRALHVESEGRRGCEIIQHQGAGHTSRRECNAIGVFVVAGGEETQDVSCPHNSANVLSVRHDGAVDSGKKQASVHNYLELDVRGRGV